MSNLNNVETLCFIGGDLREKYCAFNLSKYYKINLVGDIYKNISCEKIKYFDNISRACMNADYIILPIPVSKVEHVISFDELINIILKVNPKLVFGGLFSPYQVGLLQSKGIEYTDYLKDEVFNIHNAFITAEGALMLASEKLNTTLRFSSCAVLGYGRIGKALCNILRDLKADVTVFARRDETLAVAMENGLKTEKIDLKSKNDNAIFEKFNVIFNTVPSRIISNETLLSINENTVLIELASAPGGFDFDIAEQSGVIAVKGQMLPNRYAPMSAGKILSDTIIDNISKRTISKGEANE